MDAELKNDNIERIVRSRKPRACPACGHKPVANILYGMPAFSKELEADMESGKVVLGGCCISEDDPTWECAECHQQIYRSRA